MNVKKNNVKANSIPTSKATTNLKRLRSNKRLRTIIKSYWFMIKLKCHGGWQYDDGDVRNDTRKYPPYYIK